MIRLRPQTAAYCMLALVMLLWAGNSIVARAVHDAIPPFFLALLRWTGALLAITPFAIHHVREDHAAIVRNRAVILLLGLLGVAAFNAFLYSGLRYTTASNGMLLQAAIPALVLLVDFVIFRVRAGVGAMAGVALSTFGVVIIVLQGHLTALSQVTFNRGDALILGGVLTWSFYTSLLRLRPKLHALSFLAVTFAIGVVAMLPLAATEWAEIAAMRWTPQVIGAVFYVALLPSVVAYGLFNAAVASVGPASAGQAITLMPLFGALLAAAILGEQLHQHHLVGMALILGGIIVSAVVRARSGTNVTAQG
ncbi:DMT family transporter [Sphingomonas psychrotolerans]|uniref:DMT family transporter n=1 Tax=Sphingomonas psychrotolerans TaxID=1327635 RepID=A0ABU3N6P9_9SPHN|nr:DMT family transporter [Sphingomonas psychrotolerans]MDT8759966.1 DMT family transporter [Sphingomonas psychrotolerans]